MTARLWAIVAVSALVFGAEPTALAAGNDGAAEANQPRPLVQANCQDQFRLNSASNKEQAIKRLHQCSAVQDISASVENFTFWYITLPAPSRPESDTRFQRAIDHNTEILTGSFINLKKNDAVTALDQAIVNGLKRASRDDLVGEWLSTHNVGMFQTGAGTGASENAVETRSRAVTSEKPKVATASARISVRHVVHRPERLARSNVTPNADPERYSSSVSPMTAAELNIRERGDQDYHPGWLPATAPQQRAAQGRDREAAVAPPKAMIDGSAVLQASPVPIAIPVGSMQPRVQQQLIYPPSTEQMTRSVVNLIDQNARIFQQTVVGIARALGPH